MPRQPRCVSPGRFGGNDLVFLGLKAANDRQSVQWIGGDNPFLPQRMLTATETGRQELGHSVHIPGDLPPALETQVALLEQDCRLGRTLASILTLASTRRSLTRRALSRLAIRRRILRRSSSLRPGWSGLPLSVSGRPIFLPLACRPTCKDEMQSLRWSVRYFTAGCSRPWGFWPPNG